MERDVNKGLEDAVVETSLLYRRDAENWRAVAGNMAQCLLAAIEDLHRLGRRHADEQAHAMAEQYEHSFARQCRAHDVTP
jgi:hypothetical protein